MVTLLACRNRGSVFWGSKIAKIKKLTDIFGGWEADFSLFGNYLFEKTAFLILRTAVTFLFFILPLIFFGQNFPHIEYYSKMHLPPFFEKCPRFFSGKEWNKNEYIFVYRLHYIHSLVIKRNYMFWWSCCRYYEIFWKKYLPAGNTVEWTPLGVEQ